MQAFQEKKKRQALLAAKAKKPKKKKAKHKKHKKPKVEPVSEIEDEVMDPARQKAFQAQVQKLHNLQEDRRD